MTNIDPKIMAHIKDHAKHLETLYNERNKDFDLYDEAYLLDWSKATEVAKKNANATVVQSPDARNYVKGAVRLMIATDPIFSFKAPGASKGDIEKLERSAEAAFVESGMIAGVPIHHDQILSGVLYSEIHTAVTLTKDLVTLAEKATKAAKDDLDRKYADAAMRRAEATYKQTPFLIETWSPRGGYPSFDAHGLNAYYRKTETTIGEIVDRFGIVPEQVRSQSRYKTTTLHMFIDPVYTAYWCTEADLYLDEHKLSQIPVVVQLIDSSNLFDKPEQKRQPLLYTLIKSGLWDSQSIAMSAIYTMVFQLGVTPIFKHQQGASGKTADESIDFEQTPAVWEMEPGEDIEAMLNKGLIDPALMEAYGLSQTKGEESAIFKQALGAPLGGNSAFSTVALLSQAGRLPLIGMQTGGAWGISRTIELALMMLKEDKQAYKHGDIDLSPANIPDGLRVSTKLDVKLPQDKLQMANIAMLLYNNGMASLEWIQENILQITDTEAMRKQIWNEQAERLLLQETVKQLVMAEQVAQQPAAPSMPGTETPPTNQGSPMEPPPEMTAGPTMAPGQGTAVQGIPPQQAGMVPGQGRAAVPPEGGI